MEFETPEQAQEAIEKLTDTELNGRKIFVREDREEDSRVGGGPSGKRGGHFNEGSDEYRRGGRGGGRGGGFRGGRGGFNGR